MRSKKLQDLLDHLKTAPEGECSPAIRAKLVAFAEDPHAKVDVLGEIAKQSLADAQCSPFMMALLETTYKIVDWRPKGEDDEDRN